MKTIVKRKLVYLTIRYSATMIKRRTPWHEAASNWLMGPWPHPWRALEVWQGGLALIGGLISATLAGVWYARRVRLPILPTADLAAPGLGLGIAVGRIGGFLTGLHPGRPTSLPWGIENLGAVRHPIPLYESVIGLGFWRLAWCFCVAPCPLGRSRFL